LRALAPFNVSLLFPHPVQTGDLRPLHFNFEELIKVFVEGKRTIMLVKASLLGKGKGILPVLLKIMTTWEDL
jgi:hypothetical protein